MTPPDAPDPSPPAIDTPPRPRQRVGLSENVRTMFGAVLIALALRSFAYEPFTIPSGSMLPALLVGDYLFVAKWPYGYSRYSLPLGVVPFAGRLFGRAPERGDIVVFREPGQESVDYIKRVIGLPGDRIELRRGVLHLNGQRVPQQRIADFITPITPNMDCQGDFTRPGFRAVVGERLVCRIPRYRETLPNGVSYEVLDLVPRGLGDDTGVYVVPAGHYFMMGDNRDDSADSRFAPAQGGVGFVPEQNLVGRAAFLFFSTDGSASFVKPWTWLTATRAGRIGEDL